MRGDHATEDCSRNKIIPSFIGHGKASRKIGQAPSRTKAGNGSGCHVGYTEKVLQCLKETQLLVSRLKGASRRRRVQNLLFKDVCVFDGTGWVAKGLAGGQVRSRDVPDVGGAHLEMGPRAEYGGSNSNSSANFI